MAAHLGEYSMGELNRLCTDMLYLRKRCYSSYGTGAFSLPQFLAADVDKAIHAVRVALDFYGPIQDLYGLLSTLTRTNFTGFVDPFDPTGKANGRNDWWLLVQCIRKTLQMTRAALRTRRRERFAQFAEDVLSRKRTRA